MYSRSWQGTSIYTPECSPPALISVHFLRILSHLSRLLPQNHFFEFSRKLPVPIACHQYYLDTSQKEKIPLLIKFLSTYPILVEASSLLCVAVKHLMHVICLWWWTAHTAGGVHHWGWALLAHHGSRGVSSLGWMGRNSRCCSECNVASLDLAKAFTSKVVGSWTRGVTWKS